MSLSGNAINRLSNVRSKFLSWSARISAVVWVSCIVAVIILVGISTKLFTGTVQDTKLGNSNLFVIIFLSLVGLGVLSFGILILSIIVNTLLEKKVVKFEKSFKGVFTFPLKIFLLLAFLPLFLLYNVSGIKYLIVKTKKKGFKFSNLVGIIAILVTVLPLWVGGYWVVGTITAHQLGYVPQDMPIVGTGSMYPTWPKGTKGKTHKELAKEIISTAGFLPYPNGIVLGGRRFFGHTLGRGDIITWRNDSTRKLTSQDGADPAGLLKRLIGLPGDTIELRGGIVYLNSDPQKEPYIAKPHSTFGEKFLKECQVVTVPKDEIFAMGDNRKGSADSREIGFAPMKDIDYVLPLSKQKGKLDKNWRDTSRDLEESSKIRLNKEKYLELLNDKRKEAGVKLLKYQPKLEQSALKRGEIILKFDDYSFEATKSGYTMDRAMRDVGYSNIAYGEAPTQGYYEADELIENQFEFPESKKFLLDNDYQEIGIAEVEGEVNGCPMQVLVQHFAGYIPPNYSKELIESWKTPLADLIRLLPSWENIRNYSLTYNRNKQDADRLIQIYQTRISRSQQIVSKMESGKWLSEEENRWTYEDKALYNEQESIAKRLNSFSWQR